LLVSARIKIEVAAFFKTSFTKIHSPTIPPYGTTTGKHGI